MSEQKPLPWIVEAEKYIGLKEIKGAEHNPTIVGWLRTLGAWWFEDETPWCGSFAGHCLRVGGRKIPKHWYRALAYATHGTVLTKPAYGCVATTKRKGGGHVFFVVGVTEKGDIVGLGGNQGNEVNLRIFPKDKINSYAWPPTGEGVASMPYPERFNLPVYKSKNLTLVGSMT